MKNLQSTKIIPKNIPKQIKYCRVKSSSNFPIIPFDNQTLKDKSKKTKNALKKSPNILNKNTFNDIHTSTKQKINRQLNSADSKRIERKISTKSKNYKKIVNLLKFIDAQKKVFNCLKNKYKSPYMEYLIKKGYYKQSKSEDYPKYYNNYQIGYILENKKCRVNVRYKECVLIYNNQEYFIKYFKKNESKLVISYLVKFIYNKDKNSEGLKQTVLKLEAKNKIITLIDKDIRDLFWKMTKNNYCLNGEYSEKPKSNNQYSKRRPAINFLCGNLTLLKPIIKKDINYFYVKDIPFELLCNAIPNLSPIDFDIKIYLKDYLTLYKFRKIVKLENNKKKIIEKKPLEKIENVKNYFKNETPDNGAFNFKKRLTLSGTRSKDFIIDLSSSSEDDDDNSDNIDFNKMKYNHNSNRRLEKDLDICDIEDLVNKILYGCCVEYEKSHKSSKRIIKKKITKFSRDSDVKTSERLNENKKKDEFFISSVKYNKINDHLKKTNQEKIIISEKNRLELSIKNKITRIRNLNKERRIQYYNSLLSSNSKNFPKSKSLIKIKKKLAHNNSCILLNRSKTNTNNNKLIRKNSTYLQFKHPVDFYTKFESRKLKINKSKLTLKEFNKCYGKYKNISQYISKKNIFKGRKNTAFNSNYSGINLFEKKPVNEWEDKKEEEHQLKRIHYSKKIMGKAKDYIEKKKNVFSGCKNLNNLDKFIFRADIY